MAMSAPSSPGEANSVSARGSVAITASAPPACNAAMTPRKSRILPEVPGYCSSAPKTAAGSRSFIGSPTMMVHPSGSARVRATAIVCGWHSASNKNRLRCGFPTAARACPRNCLRVAFGVDEKRVRLRFPHASRHRHCFRRRCRLIEQGGICDVEDAEFGDHGLEIQQSFEPPLANLGLVWCVGRVPGGILKDVALNDRRQDRPVVSLTD